jgi:glycosyltransferase involved in cell wall biosynthesis
VTKHVVVALEALPYPMDVRVRAQVRAMVEAGHAVTVVCPTGHGHYLREESLRGVRILRFAAPAAGRGIVGYAWEFGASLLRMARLLRALQRETRIDVLVVCNPPDLAVGLKWVLARPRPPVVFDFREISPELFDAKFAGAPRPVAALLRALLLSGERLAFHGADVVTTVSDPFRRVAIERGGMEPKRVFLVGNGPEAGRVFPVPPRPELRRGRERLVLWLGSMSRQEGLQRLVQAADELVNVRGRHDVAFAVVGPGDVHDELRQEIRVRGLEHVVRVAGAVDDEHVREYMATADVCIGVDESNPMNDRAAMRKIFEYMAAGRPVVQFPLAEMRRLCGDTTAYAANADVRDLARVIDELLADDETRRRLGRAARRRVQDGLMWEDQAPALVAALETALTA